MESSNGWAICTTQHDRLLTQKAELESILSQKKLELASPEPVRQYVEDLRQFIESRVLTERRSFIKSFIKEIRIFGKEGRIRCIFPIPPDSREVPHLETGQEKPIAITQAGTI